MAQAVFLQPSRLLLDRSCGSNAVLGTTEAIGKENFFATVRDAVAAMQEAPSPLQPTIG